MEQASGSRYRALMDAAIDGIVLIDDGGRIRDVNQAALALFGYAADELLGRNVSCLMPSPYADEHASYIARYQREGDPRIIGIGREVPALRKDGSQFPIDLAVGEFRDEQGAGFVGFIRDLSRRHAMQDMLAEREQELARQREKLAESGQRGVLAELAAGIAHEINQPVAAISTYAQACLRLASNPADNGELITDTLQKIHAQAERAGGVVASMRRLVRQQAPEAQPVAVNSLLADVESLLRPESEQVALKMSRAPDEPVVLGDALQLQQVLLNLVRNAREASPDIDRVVVELSAQGKGEQWVELRVADRGPGLGDAAPESVFLPFFSGRQDGLGLGLSICKTLVEAHGGHLSYRPRAGGGSCFTVLLPRADESQ